MKKSIPGSMAQASLALFNEPLDVVLPRLMRELKAPHRAAAVLGAAPNSARKWVIARGWTFNGTEWVEPLAEQEHA